jgi:hypothetical protein
LARRLRDFASLIVPASIVAWIMDEVVIDQPPVESTWLPKVRLG